MSDIIEFHCQDNQDTGTPIRRRSPVGSVLVSFSLYSSLSVDLVLSFEPYTLTPENLSSLASSHASTLRPSELSKNLVHSIKQRNPSNLRLLALAPDIHILLEFHR
jgi:hypothetical protein